MYSESLNDESLEFMCNLINIKEIYPIFEEFGMKLEYLEDLLQKVNQFQLGGSKNKTFAGKLTQVINDIKQLN